MPGVPLSTGCHTCRKSKKKCEGDKPPCVRCQRLKTSCVGMGQRRYKFLPTATPEHPQQMLLMQEPWNALPLTHIETPNFRLARVLVCSLNSGGDIRYQLPWNFGPFLEDIPRRLGVSACLDNSTAAAVTVYKAFRTRDPSDYAKCLHMYARAINSMRVAMNDPELAQTSEVFCSTMLLIIFETLMSASDGASISHAAGASYILRCRGSGGPKNQFERLLYMSIGGPIILQSLLLPQLPLSKKLWSELIEDGLSKEALHINPLPTLARFASLYHDVKSALRDLTAHRKQLHDFRREAVNLRKICKDPVVRQSVVDMLDLGSELAPAPSSDSFMKSIMHANAIRAACFCNAVQILINLLLAVLVDDLAKGEIMEECAMLSDEISQLMVQAMPYRPLGTVYSTFVLSVAYAGVNCDTSRATLVLQMRVFKQNFIHPADGPRISDLETVTRRFRLEDVERPPPGFLDHLTAEVDSMRI